MGMSRKYRSQSGTTLLEVMVAVAISSIALFSFIGLVITSIEMEDYARKMTEAVLIGDDRLKEIERSGYPEPGQKEGLIDDEDPQGFSYRVAVTDTAIDGVRQVEYEVLWDNKKKSVNLVAFIAKR